MWSTRLYASRAWPSSSARLAQSASASQPDASKCPSGDYESPHVHRQWQNAVRSMSDRIGRLVGLALLGVLVLLAGGGAARSPKGLVLGLPGAVTIAAALVVVSAGWLLTR